MLTTELSNFLNYLFKQKRVSKHTKISYENDLTQFFEFLNQEIVIDNLNEITHQHIRGFLAHLMDKKYEAKSVNRKLSALKSYFKYLHKQELVTANVATRVQGPKTKKKLPVFLDESETKRLFNEIKFNNDFEGIRDKVVLDLLYQTGLRREELLSLKTDDFDIFNTQLKVLGKRNKERIIPFDIPLKRNLESYFLVKKELNLDNPYFLINPKNKTLSPSAATALIKKLLSYVNSNSKNSPHTLRHTFATHLLNNGADINAVKELLGHSSLQATQVYTHNTIDKLKKSYKQAHPRSGE